MKFANHGCNGTYNVGDAMNDTEFSVDPNQFLGSDFRADPTRSEFFNPSLDRQHWIVMSASDSFLVDVQAGQEVLDNYMAYLQEHQWTAGIRRYQNMCS